MNPEHSQPQNNRVGLLGAGLMGSAMAHRLLDQGIPVIAWDRNSEQVHALADRGATQAPTPGEVVSGAGVVITMLPTAEIVLDVVEPLLENWPEDVIWLQMSSVGAGEADQLAPTLHTRSRRSMHPSRGAHSPPRRAS